jgi:peptidyl-prolyl cis-trans isomerase D
MLESLRNFSKSWIMRGILIALAATFALFFGTDFGHQGGGLSGNSSVVEVGETNFTIHEVGREFNEMVRQLGERTGSPLDNQTAIRLGVLDQAVSILVTRTLFDQAAQDLGVAAPVAAASATIRDLPQFRDATGRFSRARFEQFLGHSGQTEGAFVNEIRLQLLRNQYIGSIQSAAAVPDAMTDALHARRGERRIAEIVTVPLDVAAAAQTPDETQLLAFYDANKDRFRTPEFRAVSLASMTPAGLAARITVPEEEIAEEYAARSNEFREPERRAVTQATFLSRDDAIRALALVEGGKTFAQAAEEVSGLAPVDLGTVTRSDIPVAELADAAFTATADTVSAPVESPLGWHVVQVGAITPARTVPLSEARDGLRAELAAEEARDAIFDMLNDVEDGLAGGAGFDEVARDNALNVETVAGIARDGTLETGAPAGDAVSPDLLARVFAIAAAGETELVENRSGGFTLVRLDAVRAPRIPALDEVREQAISACRSERARQAAEEKASQIAEKARAGAAMEALAGEFGARYEKTAAFDRTGEGATVPLLLVAPIFESERGAIIESGVAAGAAVAKLVEIQAAAASDQARADLANALAAQIADDLVAQLSNALQNAYTVDVDRAAIEAAFSPQ